VTLRPRAAYDHLRKQREGQVHMLFHEFIVVAQLYHAMPKRVTALRVQRLLPVPPTTTSTAARERMIGDLARKLEDDAWIAAKAMSPAQTPAEVKELAEGFTAATGNKLDPMRAGVAALAGIADLAEKTKHEEPMHTGTTGSGRVSMTEEEENFAPPAQQQGSGTPRRASPQQQAAAQDDHEPPAEGATPSGFEDSFDYRPRTASRLSKMGVGPEDIAAIKPQDVSTLGDADVPLKDLPPEAVDTLRKGAAHISKALFNETRGEGE
jgi:hypothetical protein